MNDKITNLLTILTKVQNGDFSQTITIPAEEDDFTELTKSIQQLIILLQENSANLQQATTEKKQIQDAFYRQKQDFTALAEESPDIIMRFDRELRFVYVNPVIEKYTGIAPASFIGKTHQAMSMPEGHEQYWTESIEAVFRTGKEARIEFFLQAPDKQIRYYQGRLVPEQAQDQSIQYVLGVAHDITELKQRTEELEKERVKDQAILANIGDGLIVTDKEGRIILMNQVAQELLRVKIKDVAGKVFIDLVRMEDDKENSLPSDSRPLSLALQSHKKIAASSYYRRSDNTKFPVAMTVTPLVISSGVVGAIEVFRDITRSAEVEHAKDEFISLVSHELRTPITAVKGLVSMALNGDYGELGEKLRQPLTNVYISAERQIHVINDILNISRLQAGKIKYSLANFPLEALTAEVVASMELLARQKRITLTIEGNQEMQVQGDNIWVKEILHNIIVNAVKFTTKGGVKVSYRIDGDQAMVVVTDTGAGIPPEGQARLFQKFEKLTTPELGRAIGSGLGLYIAREVARKMGGDVVLEKSVPGEGSTFVLSLPKADTSRAREVKSALEKKIELSLNKK